MGFFSGTKDRFETRPRFNPEIQSALSQLLQRGLAGTQEGQGGFAPIAERETRRFQEETVPSIAERFTTLGAQGSSGFADALSRGGTQLGTNLAALGSQHELQRQNQFMQMLGMGTQQQEDTIFTPGQQGLFGAMAPGLGTGLGALAGTMMGGPVGGAAGGAAGGALIKWLMSLLGGGGQQQQSAPGSVVAQLPKLI